MFTKVRMKIAPYEIEHTQIGNLPIKTKPLSLTKFLALQKAVLRIRDVYPRSQILIFIHPGSRISVMNIFVAKTLRIIGLFTQNFFNKLSKILVWNRGSEIQDPEKTYSGSRIQGHKGTGSRIRNSGKK
jgi:hypothetical protein